MGGTSLLPPEHEGDTCFASHPRLLWLSGLCGMLCRQPCRLNEVALFALTRLFPYSTALPLPRLLSAEEDLAKPFVASLWWLKGRVSCVD